MRARLSPPRVLLTHTCTQDGWFLQPQRRPARLPCRTVPSNCICRCSRMRARLPLHIPHLHTQVSRCAHTYQRYASFSDICGAWFGFGSGFGIGFTLTLLLARAPLLLSTLRSHTIPFPQRSLVCGGQPSPHKPRLVSHCTCPPLSSSPHAHSFVLGTAVINNNNAADGIHWAGLRGKRWRGQRVAETFDVLHLKDKRRDRVRAPTTAAAT